jgi:hypothetical protein
MKLLLENWREYLKESQEFLYHGTSAELAQKMIDSVTSVTTYWGDLNTANDYARTHSDSAIIKIPLRNIGWDIEPNEALIQAYEQDFPEDLEEWNNSQQTALNSLKIFGSVILPPGIYLEGAEINETPT